jgi:hypothetical protein
MTLCDLSPRKLIGPALLALIGCTAEVPTESPSTPLNPTPDSLQSFVMDVAWTSYTPQPSNVWPCGAQRALFAARYRYNGRTLIIEGMYYIRSEEWDPGIHIQIAVDTEFRVGTHQIGCGRPAKASFHDWDKTFKATSRELVGEFSIASIDSTNQAIGGSFSFIGIRVPWPFPLPPTTDSLLVSARSFRAKLYQPSEWYPPLPPGC